MSNDKFQDSGKQAYIVMSAPSAARFGEKLRLLRRRHGMTLAHMADELGYKTHSYISEIESGRKTPTVAFVLKVADLFSVSTDVLLRDEYNINTSPGANPDEVLE